MIKETASQQLGGLAEALMETTAGLQSLLARQVGLIEFVNRMADAIHLFEQGINHNGDHDE